MPQTTAGRMTNCTPRHTIIACAGTGAPARNAPRNAASALLCRCGEDGASGVLAIASEQSAAFGDGSAAQWLQAAAALLALESSG